MSPASQQDQPLSGRHAWVIGATGGIGQATAVALAQSGANVHLVGRDADRIAGVEASLTDLGLSAKTHVRDVTGDEAVSGMFDSAPVDVLVNAAGINVPQLVGDVQPESFDEIFDVNVRATFFIAQEAIRVMRANNTKGSIILVTSQMGHVGGPKRTVYCGSKWAVEGMTRAMALELAPEGIRVNTVAPTFVDTPMTHAALQDDEFRNYVLGSIPMGKLAKPEDVASAVSFLAVDGAKMITGTSIVVDGGWTAV